MDVKRFFLYAIVIAALTLAGCGGNGGGGTDMTGGGGTPPPPAQVTCPDGSMAATMDDCPPAGPTPEEMALKDAQDAAMAAYMAAMAAVGGAKDYVAMQNAQKYAAMAKEANDSAQAATTSAMAEEYQAAAETASANAMEAAMMRGLGITTLANKITNQNAIDNAILEDRDPPKPVSNAGRVGAALGTTAAAASAVADTPAVTGPPALDAVTAGSSSQGGAASARATYSASGPMLTVTTTADAVTRGEDPTSLMTRGGWMGAELVGEAADGTTTTYANVYTDIQAPTVKDTYQAADADATHTATELGTQLANNPEITGDVPNDGSSFTAMYNENPEDNNPPVPGMFSCPAGTAGGCAISVKDGVVESITGYIFQPRVSVGTNRVPDADYLAWGVWLRVPSAEPADANDDGVEDNPATAGAFASGNDVFAVYPQLKGKATYNGVANGLYSAGGYVEQFEADVMLEANFGGTDGADSTPGSAPAATDNDSLLLGVVTGMVSNINAGGMAVDGSLMLGRAPVTRAADSDTMTTTGFNGDTSGSLAGRAMSGEWGGQFYGPNDATNDMGRQTEYPTTAAGTFGASAPGNVNDPVRILGAFGSWKAD